MGIVVGSGIVNLGDSKRWGGLTSSFSDPVTTDFPQTLIDNGYASGITVASVLVTGNSYSTLTWFIDLRAVLSLANTEMKTLFDFDIDNDVFFPDSRSFKISPSHGYSI